MFRQQRFRAWGIGSPIAWSGLNLIISNTRPNTGFRNWAILWACTWASCAILKPGGVRHSAHVNLRMFLHGATRDCQCHGDIFFPQARSYLSRVRQPCGDVGHPATRPWPATEPARIRYRPVPVQPCSRGVAGGLLPAGSDRRWGSSGCHPGRIRCRLPLGETDSVLVAGSGGRLRCRRPFSDGRRRLGLGPISRPSLTYQSVEVVHGSAPD